MLPCDKPTGLQSPRTRSLQFDGRSTLQNADFLFCTSLELHVEIWRPIDLHPVLRTCVVVVGAINIRAHRCYGTEYVNWLNRVVSRIWSYSFMNRSIQTTSISAKVNVKYFLSFAAQNNLSNSVKIAPTAMLPRRFSWDTPLFALAALRRSRPFNCLRNFIPLESWLRVSLSWMNLQLHKPFLPYLTAEFWCERALAFIYF